MLQKLKTDARKLQTPAFSSGVYTKPIKWGLEADQEHNRSWSVGINIAFSTLENETHLHNLNNSVLWSQFHNLRIMKLTLMCNQI
jgi:hypothetical protein